MPLLAGDRVHIKAEWREPNEPDIEYFVVHDEEKGRLDISPVEWKYQIRPISTVTPEMVEALPPKTADDFAALKGKQKFLIVAKRDGKTVYATSNGAGAAWTNNLEFAYVYDAQDNGDMKLKYWTAIAKLKGIDPATVEAQPCEF